VSSIMVVRRWQADAWTVTTTIDDFLSVSICIKYTNVSSIHKNLFLYIKKRFFFFHNHDKFIICMYNEIKLDKSITFIWFYIIFTDFMLVIYRQYYFLNIYFKHVVKILWADVSNDTWQLHGVNQNLFLMGVGHGK
jgi:hypothetical protein